MFAQVRVTSYVWKDRQKCVWKLRTYKTCPKCLEILALLIWLLFAFCLSL